MSIEAGFDSTDNANIEEAVRKKEEIISELTNKAEILAIEKKAWMSAQHARAQNAEQQPQEQPGQQPGLHAPTPLVLRTGGAAPARRGRPPGSKNKPSNGIKVNEREE